MDVQVNCNFTHGGLEWPTKTTMCDRSSVQAAGLEFFASCVDTVRGANCIPQEAEISAVAFTIEGSES